MSDAGAVNDVGEMNRPGGRRLALWRHGVGYGLTGLIVVVFGIFLLQNRQVAAEVVSARPLWLLVLAFMFAASLIARTCFLDQLLRALGTTLSGRECFQLVAASELLSTIALPTAGGVYRAYYLWRYHRVAVLPFMVGTVLFNLVGTGLWCVLAAGSVAAGAMEGSVPEGRGMWAWHSSALPGGIYRGVIVLSLGLIFGVFGWWKFRAVLGSPQRHTIWAAGRWGRVLAAALVTTLASAAIQLVGFGVVLQLLGVAVQPLECVAIVASHQAGSAVGVTPGALGVQEGAGLLAAHAFELDLTRLGVVLGMVRTARLALAVLIGLPCWWSLSRVVVPLPQS